MDLGALSSVFSRASTQFSTWLSLQEAVKILASNASNIVQRLPAIQSASHYKGLPAPAQLRELVVAQTLASFDNVLGRLHVKLGEMEDCVRVQEKLCLQAWDALGVTPSFVSSAQPQLKSGVSPAQMVEAMEDAWYMCRDELCLKASVMSHLHPAMTPAEYQAWQEMLQGSVHVKADAPSALLLLNC